MKEHPILFSAPMIRALLAGTKTQTRRIVKWRPSQVMCSPDCRGEAGPDYQWSDPGLGAGGYLKVGCKDGASQRVFCRHGEPGDCLWVRETFGATDLTLDDKHRPGIHYRATDGWPAGAALWGWRPSIYMPRWASRITLEISDVRAERLQDISEADALAEGVVSHVYEAWSVWDPACEATVSLMVEPTPADIARHGYEDVRHIGPKQIGTARDLYLALWDAINIHRAPAATNPWVWALTFSVQ